MCGAFSTITVHRLLYMQAHRFITITLVSILISTTEWANRSFKKKNLQKNTILVKFFGANRSFFVSERAICSKKQAIRSQSLICPEKSERTLILSE